MIYLGVFSVIMVFGLLESYLIRARKLKASETCLAVSETTTATAAEVSDGS